MMAGQAPEPLRIGVLGAARIAAHGVERVLDGYAQVVADPEVEVVYNPLANGLHGPWNLAAIAAGRHVLTEKPSASNAAEAREVHDAAAAAGVTLLEGFHYLHHPVTRRLQGLLATGELGELRHVEVELVIPAPADDDPRWSLELAGGALMDLGCYGLHAHRLLAPWAGGPPRVVAARGGERAGHPGVDEWFEADLEFPGGATGSARCDMAGQGVRFQPRPRTPRPR
jgi:predicted dehydrogenase